MTTEQEQALREALERYHRVTRAPDVYGTKSRRDARAGATLAREVNAVLNPVPPTQELR